ncbi:hypothetical protein WL93_01355 [Burkholderia diffusa]|uniref:hypothetical protein n=1 Tax=Burkholderia diffusa TaxID=488732 RepID=UPI000752E909|nr:hypothetical protein [Burkholderia diffusa]KWF80846.1 hypothetical protein WL93_01355 [Burkholderia diffusa]
MWRYLVILALWWTRSACALSIGDLTYFMGPQADYLAREVTNDSDRTRVYSVHVSQSAPPYADAKTWRPEGGELMYAPTKLILRPQKSGWLKLYYRGVKDGQARYYRVVFKEEPAVQIDKEAVEMKPRLSLESILVVQPRQARQSYRIEGNELVNDGNTVYLATAFGRCPDPRNCFRDRFLAPGERMDISGLVGGGESVRVVLGNEVSRASPAKP